MKDRRTREVSLSISDAGGGRLREQPRNAAINHLALSIALLFALDCGGEPAPFYGRTLWSEPMKVEGVVKVSEPQAMNPWCGYYAFCCYLIQCKDGTVDQLINVDICPKSYGFPPYNLEGAWRYWQYRMTLEVRSMNAAKGEISCGIKEMGCFDEPVSYCPTYPPGYPG